MFAEINCRMFAIRTLKRYLRMGAVSCGLFGAPLALASDCNVWLSGNEVDYGRLHRGELMDLHSGQN